MPQGSAANRLVWPSGWWPPEPAHLAGDGQSLLAAVTLPGHREDQRRPWRPGRVAQPSRVLDWLAVEFIESGWNVKQFQKLIVTSGAYMQSSKVTPALLAKTPRTCCWPAARGFRLDAEVVRDQALYLGGLLIEKVGGKGVKPYQPGGIWEPWALWARTPATSSGTTARRCIGGACTRSGSGRLPRRR